MCIALRSCAIADEMSWTRRTFNVLKHCGLQIGHWQNMQEYQWLTYWPSSTKRVNKSLFYLLVTRPRKIRKVVG
jgi:hypothetical protein